MNLIHTPSNKFAGAVCEPVKSRMRNSVQSVYFSLIAERNKANTSLAREEAHKILQPNSFIRFFTWPFYQKLAPVKPNNEKEIDKINEFRRKINKISYVRQRKQQEPLSKEVPNKASQLDCSNPSLNQQVSAWCLKSREGPQFSPSPEREVRSRTKSTRRAFSHTRQTFLLQPQFANNWGTPCSWTLETLVSFWI